MARFIIESDYGMQIKQEIIRLLTANDADWYNSPKLVRAEQTAIRQIKHWIGRRYDTGVIFDGSKPEARDEYMVTVTIDVALYHLYSQTGMKDIPGHRQQRYQDVLDWLKEAGSGNVAADLPPVISEETGEEYSEFMFQSRKPENHKW